MSADSHLLFSHHDAFPDFNAFNGASSSFNADLFSGSVLGTVTEDLIAELEDDDFVNSLGSNMASFNAVYNNKKGLWESSSSDPLLQDQSFRSVAYSSISNGFFNFPGSSKEVLSEFLEEPSGLGSPNLDCRLGNNYMLPTGIREATTSGANGSSPDYLGEQKPFAQILADEKMVNTNLGEVKLSARRSVDGAKPEVGTEEPQVISSSSKKPLLLVSTRPRTSSAPKPSPDQTVTSEPSPCQLSIRKEFPADASKKVPDMASSSIGLNIQRSSLNSARRTSPSPCSVSRIGSMGKRSSYSIDINEIKETLLGDDVPIFRQDLTPFSAPSIEQTFNSSFESKNVGMDSVGECLSPSPLPFSRSSRPSLMQRSLSSHTLGQLRRSGHKQRLNEAPLLTQTAPLYSSVRRFGNASTQVEPQILTQVSSTRPALNTMRRVFSTGDIQKLNGIQTTQEGGSPAQSDRSNQDEGGFKIGRYTVEERKNKICRYRQKRTERNFNKKIKYACRKTLADSRPRVRGRFAKNEDVEESMATLPNQDEDEDDQVERKAEEGEFVMMEEKTGSMNWKWGLAGKGSYGRTAKNPVYI